MPYAINLDAFSSFEAASPTGALSSFGTVTSTVTAAGSSLKLTSAQTGQSVDATITPNKASAIPAAGSGTVTASYTATGIGTPSQVQHILAKATGSSVSMKYSVGGLTPGKAYSPLRGGTALYSKPITADSTGSITFTTTTGTGNTDYSVAGA